MIRNLLIYLPISITVLGLLAFAVLSLGRQITNCENGPNAMPTAYSIAVAFLAIGLGGIGMGAGAIAALNNLGLAPMLGILGFVCLCLGLGFTNAVANMKMVLLDVTKALQPQSAEG